MQKSSVQEEKQYSWIIFKVFKWPYLKYFNQEFKAKWLISRERESGKLMSFDSLDFHESKLSKIVFLKLYLH